MTEDYLRQHPIQFEQYDDPVLSRAILTIRCGPCNWQENVVAPWYHLDKYERRCMELLQEAMLTHG